MGRQGRERKRKLGQLAEARSQKTTHPDRPRMVEMTNNAYCIEPVQHHDIINIIFDEKGCLLSHVLEREITSIEHINFTEIEDSSGGPDFRFQMAIKQDGSLFAEIQNIIRNDPIQNRIMADEIDVIKILVGGTRDQVLHSDLKFVDGIVPEVRHDIKDSSNSVIISCDLAHPVKLNVLTTDFEKESDWEELCKDFVKSGKYARVGKHQSDTRVAVLQGCAIVFDGNVYHSGTPCIGACREGDGGNQFSGPLLTLRNKANKNQPPLKHLEKSDLEGIANLNRICRLFISTWPQRFNRRCDYVVKDSLTLLQKREGPVVCSSKTKIGR